MRGGSVASHIRIGNYVSPLIPSGEADILLAVNEHEVPFNMHLMKKDAQMYINSAARRQNCHSCGKNRPTARLARGHQSGAARFCLRASRFSLQYAHLNKFLQQISPPKALDLNLKAFTEGFQTVAN